MKPTGQRYRPEIDGLRAIAILCVVFFHLKVDVFHGGYAGVDIFFVISGYLITRNIVDDIEAERFSLSRFYVRRIRRLFPALLFTVAATFAVAILWYPPQALRNEARDVLMTLASVSNIHFWREAHQYFSPEATNVPLLHTWSLSVEEQYYVVWSLGLLAAASLQWRKIVPGLILVAGLASLAASQYWLSRDPVAAFYMMPFRIFELSIGALCIWAERWWPAGRTASELLFAAGLIAIGVSVISFGPATPFPGVRALLPCLGAALIIYAGTRARLAAALNNRLAVGVGLISYSLYLCHWPILVFANYIFGEAAGFWARVALLALSCGVATSMYFFIEKPFRFRAAPATPRSLLRLLGRCGAIASPVIVLALLALPQLKGSWPWRLNAEQREVVRLQSFGYEPCPPIQAACVFGDVNGPLAVEIIGDSYAQHLVAALQPFLLAHRLRGQINSFGGCLFLIGVPPDRRCDREREAALVEIDRNVVPLVISQAWLGYGAEMAVIAGETGTMPPDFKSYQVALERSLARFGGNGRRILIVGPQVAHDCRIEQYRLQPGPLPHAKQPPCADFPAEKVRSLTDDFNKMLEKIRRAHPATVMVMIPADYLCDSRCPVTKDGVWYYQDAAHLTVAGAEYLGTRASALFEQLLLPAQAPR